MASPEISDVKFTCPLISCGDRVEDVGAAERSWAPTRRNDADSPPKPLLHQPWRLGKPSLNQSTDIRIRRA